MKTEKLSQLLEKICTGEFSSSDVGLFLIWLRPAFDNDPILLDLSNFVAHSEGRDRGTSFNHVNSFVSNLLSVSERGGTLFGQPALFQKDDVMRRLINILQDYNLPFSRERFLAQAENFINSLQELMEETEFQFNDPRIVKCYVQRAGGGMRFCLQANLTGPFIKMSGSGSICSTLFN
jgi:hypothetical protein